jgi:hypothetical protein
MVSLLTWAVLPLVGLLGLAATGHAAPIRTLPGLVSITFWERTGSLDARHFPPLGGSLPLTNPDLLTRRSNLGVGFNNYDFVGLNDEFYDVFYSDANGALNRDGECLTVEAEFNNTTGGLNIAEVQLNFADGSTSYMCELASAVYLPLPFGPNSSAIAGSAQYAVDGLLSTHTTMGNTAGQPPGTRLRITLCSPCAAGSCQLDDVSACKGSVAAHVTDRHETFSFCAPNDEQAAEAYAQSQAFAAAQAAIDAACGGLRCGEQTCSAKEKVCHLSKRQSTPIVECVECKRSPIARCISPLVPWDCVVRETFRFACACNCEPD